MNSENLIRMANRIGQFFEAMPDREEALDGIATHLRKFWEPRMRRQLLELLDRDTSGADEIVVRAIERHRARLA
jgi:formate dehydrogenase subunit delta